MVYYHRKLLGYFAIIGQFYAPTVGLSPQRTKVSAAELSSLEQETFEDKERTGWAGGQLGKL